MGGGGGGRLFEAGRLLSFSAFRMGAYSRLALIRGWALIRINTVSVSVSFSFYFCNFHVFFVLSRNIFIVKLVIVNEFDT